MNMKAISSILGLFVVLPIWYYLLYQILARVNASELMMFLFWVYLPVGVVVAVLSKLADAKTK